MKQGFTLIELSIVLVIIGLIVGGILVGRDLINAAAVRATITQIEKYNTAAHTFQSKYGELPGDISPTAALNFGFAARGAYAGQGDGNGIIEGVWRNHAASNFGVDQATGETAMFWGGLSKIGLIEGAFTLGSPTVVINNTPAVGSYVPPAKIGGSNYIYVWSNNSINYYGLSSIALITTGTLTSTPGLTVSQAYNIDAKIDAGLPQTGRVTAQYVNYVSFGGTPGYGWVGASDVSATSATATTCYDNANIANATQNYSVKQSNSGGGTNCALSIQFQ